MPRRKIFLLGVVLTGAIFVHVPCLTAAPLMVEKNLFAQDRKPPSPESAAAPATAGKPGMPITNIQLDGVIIRGNNRKALLRMKAPTAAGQAGKKASKPYVVVRENQQVGDFRVVKIEPKSVSLEKEGQTFVLGLFAEGKVVIPAAPQPGAAQPSHEDNGPAAGQTQPGQAGVPPNRMPRGQHPQAMPGQQVGIEPSQQETPPQMLPQPQMRPDDAGAVDDEEEEE